MCEKASHMLLLRARKKGLAVLNWGEGGENPVSIPAV